MNRQLILSLITCLLLALFSACSETPKQSLEDAVDGKGLDSFLKQAYQQAHDSVELSSIGAINKALRPHDNLYLPPNNAPDNNDKYPIVLFF